LLSEFDLTLDWHGFELHPGTPRGGQHLSALFGPVDLDRLHAGTRRFGARFGVESFQPPDRIQNTRRALAMAEFAREHGRLEAFRRAAFEGHWRQGFNLESDEDLEAVANSAELTATSALAAADDPDYQGRVDERQSAARAAGITGIPTFDFGEQRVVGCQPYEALREAALRAGVRGRSESG
jgi:predicted DsbA family dithiol-disulfide isomerase